MLLIKPPAKVRESLASTVKGFTTIYQVCKHAVKTCIFVQLLCNPVAKYKWSQLIVDLLFII